MEFEEIAPNVIHVQMNSRIPLCRTFMRFQEHYESPYPNIKGKIFSRNMFKETYKKDRKADHFTYYTDWAGFNVPSYVFEPFYEGKFDPLLVCEQKLLDGLEQYRGKKFYVIGSSLQDKGTIEHELSHALWYTNDEYREAQEEILEQMTPKSREAIRKWLLDMGYCEDVVLDETCAYTVTDYIQCCDIGEFDTANKHVVDKLQEVYNRHSPVKVGSVSSVV